MPEPVTLTMPADCTLRNAQALQGELIAALGGAAGLVLDCAGVERVDITFVQLVVTAARTATRRGIRLELSHRPEAVEAAFRRAGFVPHAPFEIAQVTDPFADPFADPSDAPSDAPSADPQRLDIPAH